jgi:hypothetical protein
LGESGYVLRISPDTIGIARKFRASHNLGSDFTNLDPRFLNFVWEKLYRLHVTDKRRFPIVNPK